MYLVEFWVFGDLPFLAFFSFLLLEITLIRKKNTESLKISELFQLCWVAPLQGIESKFLKQEGSSEIQLSQAEYIIKSISFFFLFSFPQFLVIFLWRAFDPRMEKTIQISLSSPLLKPYATAKIVVIHCLPHGNCTLVRILKRPEIPFLSCSLLSSSPVRLTDPCFCFTSVIHIVWITLVLLL